MRFRWLLVIVNVVCALVSASQLYGGEGYFRVEQKAGVWWLVSPSDTLVVSAGVDNVSYIGDLIHGTTIHPYNNNVAKLYASEAVWGEAEVRRLRSWGFNNLGAWTAPSLWTHNMPYTVILDIAAESGSDWVRGKPLDVFDPKFEAIAQKITQEQCTPRARDPYLLGYFSDNELRWGPDWRGREGMLTMYLHLPSGAPGRRRAITFLRRKYSNRIDRLNRAWRTHATGFDEVPATANSAGFQSDSAAFLGMVAERYFRVCAKAIRAADPNHLYLGAKFAESPPDPVVKASAIADVVSVDVYSFDARPIVKHVFELTKRPVLVAEFAFRAGDSGLPNTDGAGPEVRDQVARGQAFEAFVTGLEGLPEAIGYQWFEWCDEPKQGRFDGENSNYGLVDIADQPYVRFVDQVKVANAEAASVHRKLMR